MPPIRKTHARIATYVTTLLICGTSLPATPLIATTVDGKIASAQSPLHTTPNPCLTASAIILVDDDAPDNGDGITWATAINDLQTALARADAGSEIWVAAGTYKPTTTGGPRTESFTLRNDVTVYGGFAGNENPDTFDVRHRKPAANESILSGDLGTPDSHEPIPFANMEDNSWHVVNIANTNANAILDGFTISGGYCANVSVQWNSAGGGIYARPAGNATIRNCKIQKNVGADGGGLYVSSATPTLINCIFTENLALGAGARGGAAYCSVDGDAVFVNCTFVANTSDNIVGGLMLLNNATSMTNCIAWQNADNSGTGPNAQISTSGGTATVRHCCIQGCLEGEGLCADPEHANIGADPVFKNAPDDLALCTGSPAIDAGNNSAVPLDTTTDAGGSPRIVDGNTDGIPTVDIGAYEFGDCDGNGIVDMIDISACAGDPACADCNNNGQLDVCEILATTPGGTYFCVENCDPDCNTNGIPDTCDIADCVDDPTCADCNANNLIDNCELIRTAELIDTGFEEGLPEDWSATGLWHVTDQCTAINACGPDMWAYFGQDDTCNFDTGSPETGTLTAPTISLPAQASSAALSFCYRYDGERGSVGEPRDFDLAWVTINGELLFDIGGYGPLALDAWTVETLDLTPYLGQTVTIEWHFDSVDASANDDVGLQLDDIYVAAEDGFNNDCNANGIPDDCDIVEGPNCDNDMIPDECEPDWDDDGAIDDCDDDIDNDGVPNEEDACQFTPVDLLPPDFVLVNGTIPGRCRRRLRLRPRRLRHHANQPHRQRTIKPTDGVGNTRISSIARARPISFQQARPGAPSRSFTLGVGNTRISNVAQVPHPVASARGGGHTNVNRRAVLQDAPPSRATTRSTAVSLEYMPRLR